MILPYIHKHGHIKAVFTELQIMRLGLQGKLQTPEIGYRRIIPLRRCGGFHPDWLAAQEAANTRGFEIKLQPKPRQRNPWPLTCDMSIIKTANNN